MCNLHAQTNSCRVKRIKYSITPPCSQLPVKHRVGEKKSNTLKYKMRRVPEKRYESLKLKQTNVICLFFVFFCINERNFSSLSSLLNDVSSQCQPIDSRCIAVKPTVHISEREEGKRGRARERNTLTNWWIEWVKGEEEKEGSLINNCEAARCRSTGFSLQWAGAGLSPSAVSVGLIREPLGTWQKLLAGCDGRIRRTPPLLHHRYSLHPCFLSNSHQQAPFTRTGKEGKGVKEEGDLQVAQTPPPPSYTGI